MNIEDIQKYIKDALSEVYNDSNVYLFADEDSANSGFFRFIIPSISFGNYLFAISFKYIFEDNLDYFIITDINYEILKNGIVVLIYNQELMNIQYFDDTLKQRISKLVEKFQKYEFEKIFYDLVYYHNNTNNNNGVNKKLIPSIFLYYSIVLVKIIKTFENMAKKTIEDIFISLNIEKYNGAVPIVNQNKYGCFTIIYNQYIKIYFSLVFSIRNENQIMYDIMINVSDKYNKKLKVISFVDNRPLAFNDEQIIVIINNVLRILKIYCYNNFDNSIIKIK